MSHLPSPRVLAAVAIGGMLGTAARSAIDVARPDAFPFQTLLINLSGAFLLGALLPLIPSHRHAMRGFLGTGVLGGYTTMSTFVVEADELVRGGRAGIGLLYVACTLTGGVTAATIGNMLATRLHARPTHAIEEIDFVEEDEV